MAVTRVWIEEGCISCNLCEETAPDVFEVDEVSEVKEGANLIENEAEIKEAAESCPVEVIQFE